MEARLATLPVTNVAGQAPLDLATGFMIGTEAPPFEVRPVKDLTPREAMVAAIQRHMETGRRYCVTFSGGRDSSAELALATLAARTGGHPDPVPLTLRYPLIGAPDDERVQELVVRHLGLADWERVESLDDLQLVGPVARRVLRDVGMLWPPTLHSMLPLMERAKGATFSLSCGLGDFYLFWRWGELSSVLLGHRRLQRRDLSLLAAALSPARVRARGALKRGMPPRMSWLHAEVEGRARGLIARRGAEVPLRFDRAAAMQMTHRCGGALRRSASALADEAGSTAVLLAADPGAVGAFAAGGGWRGYGTKERAVRSLAEDLLPAEAFRRGKAMNYHRVYFGEETRAFAERWSGGGLDESLVDPKALRENWLGERPDYRTGALMQAAWLHDELSARPNEKEVVHAA